MAIAEQEKPNWFMTKVAQMSDLPVIRHVLRELSRPGYVVGNLAEGDLRNALTVMMPFTEIDADEATSVSDSLLPSGTNWLGKLAVDVVTDPLTWTGFGSLTKVGAISESASAAKFASKIGKASASKAAKLEVQLARLSGRAAKLGKSLEDVGQFGGTLAEQARLGQRSLVSFAGHDIVKGQKVFDVLSAIGEYSGGSKLLGTMQDLFTRTNVGLGAKFEHALGGRKAWFKNATGMDLKGYNDLVMKLTPEQRAGLYKNTEKYGELLRNAVDADTFKEIGERAKPLKLIDDKLRAMDLNAMGLSFEEAQAIAHGQAAVERWRVLATELGMKVPDAKSSLQAQLEFVEKNFTEAGRRIGREVVREYGQVFAKWDRALKSVADDAFRGLSDKDAIELAAVFARSKGRELVNIARSSPKAAAMRIDELAKLSDNALKAVFPDPEDVAKFKRGLAEIELVTMAASNSIATMKRIGIGPGIKLPSLYSVMRNLESADAVKMVEDLGVYSNNFAPVLTDVADNIRGLIGKIDLYKKAIENTPSYLHHMLTPEAAKWLSSNPSAKRAFGSKGFSLNIHRKFVEEIEEGVGSALTLSEVQGIVNDTIDASRRGAPTEAPFRVGRAMTLDEVQGIVDDTIDALRRGAPTEAPLRGGLARQFAEAMVDPTNKAAAKEFTKLEKLIASGRVKNMRDAIDNGYIRNVANFFETDTRAIMSATQREFVEAMSHADYLENAARLFGKRAPGVKSAISDVGEMTDAVPAGWVEVPGVEKLSGVYFRRDIANKLANIHAVYSSPAEMNKVLKVWDEIQNMWKASATAWWPAFHGRNAISNVFLNFFSGMTDPVRTVKAYANATLLQMASSDIKSMKAAAVRLANVFGMGAESADDVLRKMRFDTLEGVVDGFEMRDKLLRNKAMSGTDMFNMELGGAPTIGKGAIKRIPENIKGKWSKASQVTRTVGGAIEDNSKIAHMLYMMEGGMDELSAGESAISALFDYGDVTKFEKDVMKRLFPFWTWTRKSVPAVAKAAIQHPGRIRNVSRLFAEPGTSPIVEDIDLPDELIPNYIYDQFGVPVRVDEEGNPSFFLLESWIPMFELNKITINPQDLFEEAMAMLTPLLKIPLEEGLNRSFFFKKDIERFEGERTPFIGMNPTVRQKHVLGSIRALNEIDNVVRAFPAAGPEWRRRGILDTVVKALFGVRLNDVDLKRRERTVEYEHRKRAGMLRSALRRAEANNDVENVATLKRLMDAEGIDYEAKKKANGMYADDIRRVNELDSQIKKLRRSR